MKRADREITDLAETGKILKNAKVGMMGLRKINNHTRKNELHVPTDAVLGQNYGEQQIARNAKALGIDIVQGIEVIGHLLGKITTLLSCKANVPIRVTKILIDNHVLVGRRWLRILAQSNRISLQRA